MKGDAEAIAKYHERVARRFERFNDGPYPPAPMSPKREGLVFNNWQHPGVWEDREGNTQIDIDWLLFAFELENTEENRVQVTAFAQRMMKGA